MHRTFFPNKILFLLICGLLGVTCSFSQDKPAGEIDVARCWSYPLNDEGETRIAVDGGRIILGGTGGRVEMLSNEGDKIWSSEFGGAISSNLLPDLGGLYFVTSAAKTNENDPESVLHMVSKETGITIWTLKLPPAPSHFLAALNGSIVVVSKNGVIQSLDTKSGTLKWKREIAEGFVTFPVFTTEKLFVATTKKQIFKISLGTGQIDSLQTFPYDTSALSTAGEMLIVGDERGNVTVLADGVAKPRWKFRSGAQISAVVVLNDNVLVASHDNFVYFLSLSRGGLVWKKRLSGRTSYLSGSLGPYVLVATLEGHSILYLDPSNGKVSGQIALKDDEELVSAAVADKVVYTLTSDAVHAYAANGCSMLKSGGLGKIAR
jgi:outer membrane protein assembly factor BamB